MMTMQRPRYAERERLSARTSLGVGGPTPRSYELCSIDELVMAWRECLDTMTVRPTVLGDATNVVISDAGLAGAALWIRIGGVAFERKGDDVWATVGAGESWDRVVETAVERGFGGIECMSGIPGRCGAAPIQNIGAYGQEIAEVIEYVEVLDTVSLELLRMDASACEFGYRSSRFKARDDSRHVVVGLRLRLSAAPPRPLAYEQLARYAHDNGADADDLGTRRRLVLALRRSKSMVVDPADPWSRSVGSFFTNPVISAERFASIASSIEGCPHWEVTGGVKLAAAWLIEHSGVRRGQRCGGAAISKAHALAIVNLGDATAADVVALARLVRTRVHETTGIVLEPEARLLGFDGDPLDASR